MRAEWEAPEQVQDYLARVFGTDRRFEIVECRFGWVCRPVLSAAEAAEGRGMGLGNYVVGRSSGVVTAHRSMPPELIGAEYDRAVADGGSAGYQVYPAVGRAESR